MLQIPTFFAKVPKISWNQPQPKLPVSIGDGKGETRAKSKIRCLYSIHYIENHVHLPPNRRWIKLGKSFISFSLQLAKDYSFHLSSIFSKTVVCTPGVSPQFAIKTKQKERRIWGYEAKNTKNEANYNVNRNFSNISCTLSQCCGAATFWAALAPEVQGPRANSGSDQIGSALALGK